MKLLLLLAVLTFTRSIHALQCNEYNFPANVFKKECEGNADAIKYACDQGFAMDIVATCHDGTWNNAPRCSLSTSPPKCPGRKDIIFVLDGSSSLGSIKFQEIKDIVKNVLPELNVSPDAINLGALVYSRRVFDRFEITAGESLALLRLERLSYPKKSGTRTDKGIEKGRQMLISGRPGSKRIMVIITDGRSAKPNKTTNKANQAKNSQIDIFAIGIGSNIRKNELEEIASYPDQAIFSEDTDALKSCLLEVINQICSL